MKKHVAWSSAILGLVTLFAFQNCSGSFESAQFESSQGSLTADPNAKGCAGTKAVGTWFENEADPSADVLSLGADCSGTSTRCLSKFTFETSSTDTQAFKIYVLEMNGDPATCLPVGTHSCQHQVIDVGGAKLLNYDCGSISATFSTSTATESDSEPI